MLMPDITALLSDIEVGARPFSILRRSGQWSGGRFQMIGSGERIDAVGNIQPAGQEALQFFPEGERREGQIVIYTTATIYLTEGDAISDEVEWRGESYKIIRVDRWHDWGFNIAYAQKR